MPLMWHQALIKCKLLLRACSHPKIKFKNQIVHLMILNLFAENCFSPEQINVNSEPKTKSGFTARSSSHKRTGEQTPCDKPALRRVKHKPRNCPDMPRRRTRTTKEGRAREELSLILCFPGTASRYRVRSPTATREQQIMKTPLWCANANDKYCGPLPLRLGRNTSVAR